MAGGSDQGSELQPSPQQTAAPPLPPPGQQQREPPQQQFRILSEHVLHKRYLTLYNRAVQFPAEDGGPEGPVLEYDIIGHPQSDFHFAVVFPYHSADGGSVTLIREYAQGLNQLMWCLPTGGFDPRRHTSYEACARAELSEEARLAGGSWQPLIPEEHPGIAEVKWCRNRFHSYLCIDPQPDEAPGRRDHEELTIEVVRVGLPELRRLMLSGDMLLPSVTTCFLALERLQQQGLLK
ncbi:NUDIX hydrolase domain-like [Chlorella sorokiniana]|uniref:NUDIX hydrolase domain-like n=1 Tax=Chlorella sorokiniana TaxID=3076 RepID=A0A2P6TPY8_CHLSO|nr:NUDIX hydrolase domain-like [Chlorella sorokiniana]|eukprot:PRW56079.1 NUDIX hydrolase domain-like [Chlorella sorokiniana]